MLRWIISLTIAIAITILRVETCNEAVCGSVVSKCLLTQSCNCDFNFENCTCCKVCFNCLSYLYSECCSCVDMCPKPNATGNTLSKKSHVEDFMDTVPGLFSVLTESPDPLNRWSSIVFPVELDINQYAVKKEVKLHMQSAEQEVIPKSNTLPRNCTVAFWSQCMSWTKCKSSCQSMGSSSYRWFHDGCCECIGQYCINYGVNESKCKDCPISDEKVIDEITDEDLVDYGEDENEYENEMNMGL